MQSLHYFLHNHLTLYFLHNHLTLFPRNFWELSGKSKLPPRSGSSLEAVNPIRKKKGGAIKFFFFFIIRLILPPSKVWALRLTELRFGQHLRIVKTSLGYYGKEIYQRGISKIFPLAANHGACH